MPKTQDCLHTIAGAKIFSSLDIPLVYNQILVRTEDIPKTAVATKQGLFEFDMTPFGLCIAPERMMEIALAGLQWSTCFIYLDDVLIFSRNFEQQVERLQEVFCRIQKANLKLKPTKCHLFKEEIAFLGHILSSRGVAPNKENIQKIVEWEPPKRQKKIANSKSEGESAECLA